MEWKNKSIIWWVIAFLFTIAVAYYQRVTGPTYPKTGKITFNNQEFKYKLITSCDSQIPAKITIEGNAEEIGGFVKYKKFKTNEKWQTLELQYNYNELTAELPPQPPAGKLKYVVVLTNSEEQIYLTEKPVIIRFKGAVPIYILILHIIIMFTAMLLSMRTGIAAITKDNKLKTLTMLTVLFLGAGGLIMGPIVQKFAFGAFWTGWPFGQDLTDNKTFVAFVFWLIAYLRLRKNISNRGWAIAAAVILLIIFLIPHSMFGSELDYSTGKIGTGR